MRRSRVAFVLVTLLVVACGGSTVSSASPTSSGNATATPLATVDRLDVVGGAVTCGNGVEFPIRALDAPAAAELSQDPLGEALRGVLAGTDPPLPRSGWRAVKAGGSKAVFVARDPAGTSWSVVVLAATGTGWTMDLAGECRLAVLVGVGIGHASWWVDPAGARLTPESRSIDVLVQEETCASGRAPIGRVAQPLVTYRPDAVIAVFGVVPLAGGQDCPGAPPAPFKLMLAAPLGNRALLDGGVIPPHDASRPPN